MSKWALCQLLGPEILILATALIALFVDMTWLRARALPIRLRTVGLISCLGCVVAIGWLTQTGHEAVSAFDGALTIDRLSQFMKQVVLVLAVFTILLTMSARFTKHVGEYFLLLLFATLGMMFLVSTQNLLMIFVALELLSLCLYIMTAFHKENIRSAEAALKYFLFGGMSAAFMLYGLSLVYGLSGHLQLSQIAPALAGSTRDPLLIMALIMTVIGFGFKVAGVPFHLWAPDAYEGAPLPSAAFIASGSKVASFFVLAKVMMVGFAGAEGSAAWRHFSQGWLPLLSIVALLSVVIGNLAAIAQRSVRRLLAYSAVAHAGYALIGLLADSERGMAALIYYVATYALTVLGAFAVVAVVQERTGDDRMGAFAGLNQRAPYVSFCMLVFMLSLAGIPPLAGFFGKFYLFTAALSAAPQRLDFLWLVIAALGMSAVSLYYYLQVLKQIYVTPASADATDLPVPLTSRVVMGVLALAVIILGCAPNLLVGPLLVFIKSM